MPSDEESDLPQLSAHAFLALQEFYKEQEEREALELSAHHSENGDPNLEFKEDWQLSQFWYDQTTIDSLVSMVLKAVGLDAKIALVSCPSLYKEMKQRAGPNAEVTLFEVDRRFAVFGRDFVLYDYRSPLSVPRDRNSHYDIVVADPPFLSEECLTKTAVTVKFLTKSKIILCTGAIMADLADRLLDLQKHQFEPHHRNNLANEFWCFTNFHRERDVP